MSESLLTVLKFCFLALVYLFLWRVVRVVVRELKADKLTVAAPPPPPPAVASIPSDGKGSRALLLEVLAPPARRGERFTLDDELTVGRAAGCGIVLGDDTFVSQVHARLYRTGRDLYVEDLGSTNGTLVNDAAISAPTRVRRGDRVQFGQTVVEVTR